MECDLQIPFNDQVVSLCEQPGAECVTNDKGEYIIRHDGKIWVFIIPPGKTAKN
jgi:hypothetical protein